MSGQRPSMGDIVTHLTMTHGFFPSYVTGINGPLWTMSVDTQFYILLPIIASFLAIAFRKLTPAERRRGLWIFLTTAWNVRS